MCRNLVDGSLRHPLWDLEDVKLEAKSTNPRNGQWGGYVCKMAIRYKGECKCSFVGLSELLGSRRFDTAARGSVGWDNDGG